MMLFHTLRRALVLLAVVACASPASADQVGTYQGAAGASPVVLELTEGTGGVWGRYFYGASRLEVDLAGAWRGQVLTLSASVTGDRISLSRSGAGWTGVLTTAKGRKLPMTLRPATAPTTAPADLPTDLDLYGRLQLAGLTLVRQAADTVDGKTIRWYREPKTGIRLFRVERGYADPAMAAMNRALARNQWGEVAAFLGCVGSDGQPGAQMSMAGKPWLGADYASYLWQSSWDCAGAAHPDFGQLGHTFDARTGRKLRLDDLLPIGPAPVPAQDTDAWYAYRSNVFAPAVVTLMTRHHPEDMKPPAGDDDCDYTDPEVWNFPSWSVTERGLWLGAIFPRVMRACDTPEWAVIPWSALPPKVRPGR